MSVIENKPKRSRKERTKAVAYLRTSSAANVGADKDSEKRQRLAISRFAKSARYDIDEGDWFNDPAVSGADPIESRPGFMALLDRIESNGVKTVLIEDASRFARDLLTQELGILSLIALGVTVFTSSGESLTDTSDPMKTAMRQIAGAFAQLEKARLVAKLKGARDRKRADSKRVTLKGAKKLEGRKSLAEKWPEAIKEARRLNDGRSLLKISEELAKLGHVTSKGKPFSASAVHAMLGAEFQSDAKKRRSYAKRKKAYYESRAESESEE